MTRPFGSFCWRQVIGRKVRDASEPGTPCGLFLAGETMAAGVTPPRDDAVERGGGPVWTGYVEVLDRDDLVGRVTAPGRPVAGAGDRSAGRLFGPGQPRRVSVEIVAAPGGKIAAVG